MASWQYVVIVAALFVLGANAQETTLAATTLADNPASAFVYVPETTIADKISVSRPEVGAANKLTLLRSSMHALRSDG